MADEPRPKGLEVVGDDPTGEVNLNRVREREDREAMLPAAARRLELVIRDSDVPPASDEAAPAPEIPRPSDVRRLSDLDAVDRAAPGPAGNTDPAPASGRPVVDGKPLEAGAISSAYNRVATSVFLGRIPFGAHERHMIASLVRTMGLTGLCLIGLGVVLVAQWAYQGAGALAVMAAVIAAAVGSWTLLAAFHFQRVVGGRRDHALELVAAFSNLRSILILKTIIVFLGLSLACFLFSTVASLLALM